MTEVQAVHRAVLRFISDAHTAPPSDYRKGYLDALGEFKEWLEYEFEEDLEG
jgi:hypothetical protein